MNRNVLIALAVGVIAGGGVLVYKLTRPSQSNEVSIDKGQPQPPQQTGSGSTTTTRPNTGSATEPTATTQPSGSGEPVREVVRDGMTIRDHRDKPSAATDPTPVVSPPGGRLLPAQVTTDLFAQIKSQVFDCLRPIPSSARGAKPTASVTTKVSIKNGLLAVDSVDQPSLADVKGDFADALSCVKSKLGSANLKTTEADITDYPITLAIPLPQ